VLCFLCSNVFSQFFSMEKAWHGSGSYKPGMRPLLRAGLPSAGLAAVCRSSEENGVDRNGRNWCPSSEIEVPMRTILRATPDTLEAVMF
jgi:hypothetical protein